MKPNPLLLPPPCISKCFFSRPFVFVPPHGRNYTRVFLLSVACMYRYSPINRTVRLISPRAFLKTSHMARLARFRHPVDYAPLLFSKNNLRLRHVVGLRVLYWLVVDRETETSPAAICHWNPLVSMTKSTVSVWTICTPGSGTIIIKKKKKIINVFTYNTNNNY